MSKFLYKLQLGQVPFVKKIVTSAWRVMVAIQMSLVRMFQPRALVFSVVTVQLV